MDHKTEIYQRVCFKVAMKRSNPMKLKHVGRFVCAYELDDELELPKMKFYTAHTHFSAN